MVESNKKKNLKKGGSNAEGSNEKKNKTNEHINAKINSICRNQKVQKKFIVFIEVKQYFASCSRIVSTRDVKLSQFVTLLCFARTQ